MKDEIKKYQEELKGKNAQEILRWGLDRFGGKIALASSFGAEDQVLTDMLVKIDPAAQIFAIDTGRLPQETYDVMEKTMKMYNIKIDILFPDAKDVSEMVKAHGPNLFYKSVEWRKLCCRTRKVEPLKKKLATLDAWICGLRKEQSVTRTGVEKIEWDEGFGLVKINPLADWTEKDVWDYIKKNNVPYNELHDKGYPSIGCAPCTRAVKPGEDSRAGRWWWETPEQKECGLHVKDGKLTRKKE